VKIHHRIGLPGSFLLAEIDGELVAAAPIDVDAEPLSDPFRPTANVRELLRLQAGYVRRHRDAVRRPADATPRALPNTATPSAARRAGQQLLPGPSDCQ
jgi:hypothetical protein